MPDHNYAFNHWIHELFSGWDGLIKFWDWGILTDVLGLSFVDCNSKAISLNRLFISDFEFRKFDFFLEVNVFSSHLNPPTRAPYGFPW
jgi:hypothetical protein